MSDKIVKVCSIVWAVAPYRLVIDAEKLLIMSIDL